MSIETLRKCKSIYKQINEDVNHLQVLKKNLKETDGRYYVTGLSACVPRRLFKEMLNKRIVESKGPLFKMPSSVRQLFREKRFVYVNHAVHAWEINYEKLTALIITKMNNLVIIEF